MKYRVSLRLAPTDFSATSCSTERKSLTDVGIYADQQLVAQQLIE
jgi:hypothetical protein